jgi:hypothetical protein
VLRRFWLPGQSCNEAKLSQIFGREMLMSIMAATLVGALAILIGSLMGALTTGWVQHRFWKHQERQKTRLIIADKIAQFYADLVFNWNLEHSSTDRERKKEASWRRESDMQLLAAVSTQLATVFSAEAVPIIIRCMPPCEPWRRCRLKPAR